MSARNFIQIAIINLKRQKGKTVSNIILITIAALILSVVSIVSLSIDEFIDNSIVNMVPFRTLITTITRDDTDEENRIFDELENDERISESRRLLYSYLFHIDDIEGIREEELSIDEEHLAVDFRAVNNDLDNLIIAGEMIHEGDSNVGLIPRYFYPDYTNEIGYLKYGYDYMDSEDLIGKTITIHYNSHDYYKGGFRVNGTYDYSFKVVGVYDNVISKDNTYGVYVPYKDFDKILTTIEGNSTENGAEMIFSEAEQVYAIVGNYDDTDSVINDYLVKNIYFRKKATMGDLEGVAFLISYVGRVIGMIAFAIVGSLLCMNCLKSVKNRICEIGMLKAVGYRSNDIKRILIAEYIFTSAVGVVLFTVLAFISMHFMEYFIASKMSMHFSDLKIIFDFRWYIVTVAMCVLVPLLSIRKTVNRISEIEITEALKTNEKM